MKKLYCFLTRIALVISHISVVCMLGIVVLITANVLLRYLFNKPIFGVYEIVEQGMLCLVFASFAYAQTKKSHVHVTLLLTRLPHIPRFIFYSLTGLLSFGISAMLTYAAFRQAAYSAAKATTTSALLIPLFPFYYVQAVSLCVFSLVLLCDGILSILAIRNRKHAEDIQSAWS